MHRERAVCVLRSTKTPVICQVHRLPCLATLTPVRHLFYSHGLPHEQHIMKEMERLRDQCVKFTGKGQPPPILSHGNKTRFNLGAHT